MTKKEKVQYSKSAICRISFYVCLSISVVLVVAGFLIPPTGVIDGSVLTAVGELLAFPAIAFAFRAVELGYDIHMEKGDASIHISNDGEGETEK